MSGTTFTFRVDDTLKAQFTQAAKSQDRSSAQLLRHFMREFVRQAQEAEEYDGWFAQEVQKAIVSANTGMYSLQKMSKRKPPPGVQRCVISCPALDEIILEFSRGARSTENPRIHCSGQSGCGTRT